MILSMPGPYPQKPSGEKRPGMLKIIFAANLAYDPSGEAVSSRIVQANGPQHADILTLQLREPYRSDARRDVGFDDAARVRPLLQRAHVHRYVGPRRACNALDQRRGPRIALGEQDIAVTKHCRQRFGVRGCRGAIALDRLREKHRQRGEQARTHVGNQAEDRHFAALNSHHPWWIDSDVHFDIRSMVLTTEEKSSSLPAADCRASSAAPTCAAAAVAGIAAGRPIAVSRIKR